MNTTFNMSQKLDPVQLLRREGWLVNHKRTERLYRMEGLNVRRNRPRRRRRW